MVSFNPYELGLRYYPQIGYELVESLSTWLRAVEQQDVKLVDIWGRRTSRILLFL